MTSFSMLDYLLSLLLSEFFEKREGYVWHSCMDLADVVRGLMHGSNLEMVRCCEGIETLSGKV